MLIFLSQFCEDGDLIAGLKKEEAEYREGLGYRIPRGFKTTMETIKFSAWKMIKALQSDRMVKKTSGRKIRKNLSAYSAKLYVGREIWNTYFKFCFERDPFDKAVSLYYWHTRNLKNRPEINDYIQSMDRSKLSNWHLYTIDDRLAVDFVGRYEGLEKDKRYITERLGLPDYSLPEAKSHTRKTRRHYSQMMNNESRRYIEEMCANEIKEFNYAWVSQAATEEVA
jgi:hypothetical protein